MSSSRFFLFLLFVGALLWVDRTARSSRVAESPPQARSAADDSVAIVNRSNPAESLSLVELRKIFLGDQTHWSNGRRITVLMLDLVRPERQVVLSQIYKMDEKDFNDYFLHSMFTGEMHTAPKPWPPPQMCSSSYSMFLVRSDI